MTPTIANPNVQLQRVSPRSISRSLFRVYRRGIHSAPTGIRMASTPIRLQRFVRAPAPSGPVPGVDGSDAGGCGSEAPYGRDAVKRCRPRLARADVLAFGVRAWMSRNGFGKSGMWRWTSTGPCTTTARSSTAPSPFSNNSRPSASAGPSSPTTARRAPRRRSGSSATAVSRPPPTTSIPSAHATLAYLRSQLPDATRLFLLGTESLARELEAEGYDICRDGGEADAGEPPDAVVVAFDTGLVYERLCRAAYWIDRGKPFIATHPDAVCPTDRARPSWWTAARSAPPWRRPPAAPRTPSPASQTR